MLVLLELFCILTVSMLVSSLWHCTIVLQDNVIGENFIVFYNCMWIGKIPWRREGQPIPVFLPWESHGQRSLVGHSPWGRKELDTAEGLTHTHTWICSEHREFTIKSHLCGDIVKTVEYGGAKSTSFQKAALNAKTKQKTVRSEWTLPGLWKLIQSL